MKYGGVRVFLVVVGLGIFVCGVFLVHIVVICLHLVGGFAFFESPWS